ncbi:hypothetical protein HMPREF0653_01055 [Prevotella disiens JCM 6334 = ATCC 29426]|uniref:Uncharacterized protein n=1 Tax=Prevotella disiens JCM 6334 = ATCC 29426 TaxID=1235811 RepID=A0ABP2Y8A1_9BACT|nr:hypothetical protein HMPREF0653_01055 [Prevotella disiens JCM 6334 = ATCC 29426]
MQKSSILKSKIDDFRFQRANSGIQKGVTTKRKVVITPYYIGLQKFDESEFRLLFRTHLL